MPIAIPEFEPYTTRGTGEFWAGTTDGKEAFLDTATGNHNMNPKTVHNLTIHDIRPQDPQPQINENGFELSTHDTKMTEEEFMAYKSEEGKKLIREKYWPEIAELVKNKTGAAKVVPWHFSVRHQTKGYHPDQIFFMKTGISQPAATFHIDNDHKTAESHMRRELGDEETEKWLAQGRWQIINIWRPIGKPVSLWPLAVVDHTPIKDWNFDERVARVYRTNDPRYYKPHDNFLIHNDDYKFNYVSNMKPEEVLIFRDYDSRRDKMRGTPHGAFQDVQSPEDAPERRSIEVRVFAQFDVDEE